MNVVQDTLQRLKPQAKDLKVTDNLKGEQWRREVREETFLYKKGQCHRLPLGLAKLLCSYLVIPTLVSNKRIMA